MARRYAIADVFTGRAFGGNPLAVYLDADGLDTRQMQVIAREMNLSETTFVTQGSAPGHFRVRIFTPAVELPFAGHPTIGTALVLAARGLTGDRHEIVLEENVGAVRVVLRADSATFFMTGPPRLSDAGASADDIAAALSLPVGAVAGTPWRAGYGVPILFVTLRDTAAVTASVLKPERWAAIGLGDIDPYVHAAVEATPGRAHLRARMFAPSVGIAEDPATGSAAASLAGSIALAPHEGRLTLAIDQGIEMGRPSRIDTETTYRGDSVEGVSVGGAAVIVGEATLLRDP